MNTLFNIDGQTVADHNKKCGYVSIPALKNSHQGLLIITFKPANCLARQSGEKRVLLLLYSVFYSP
ncbi:hypothetical protein JOC78_001811 [Bacillus ectoiniformans]|uniref:hypothetical protein n=1 Tax=Bacillus ectoiniformans TaxID=1494429 RepID=UPI001958953F|nr:hypothetical protein [Bacillus ectoiniformans]MBM7648861.1 hypothetical protein [Bacillus ectoiniformans]